MTQATLPFNDKPIMLKIGKNLVSPDNIDGVKYARKGLYILQLKRHIEPAYPIWLTEKELSKVLPHLKIVG